MHSFAQTGRMKYWKKLSHEEQDRRITQALKENIDYNSRVSLGIPASKLDPHVLHCSEHMFRTLTILAAIH